MKNEVTLTLSLAEARELRQLLEDHFYFGWIYAAGEFGVEAGGETSETLGKIYDRLLENMKLLKGEKK